MTEPRFLVVRLGSLGDIVHTFPAVAALRATYPLAEIVWLTHPRWTDLVASSTPATEIWPVDSRDLSNVRAILAKIRANPGRPPSTIRASGNPRRFLSWRRSQRIGFFRHSPRIRCPPARHRSRQPENDPHRRPERRTLPARRRSATRTPEHTAGERRASSASRRRSSTAGIDRDIVVSPGGGGCSNCRPADRFGALCQNSIALNVDSISISKWMAVFIQIRPPSRVRLERMC